MHQSTGAADYIFNVRKLILSYAVIVSANYLVVFVLLVAVYHRIWKCIRNMKKSHGNCLLPCVYVSAGSG